MVRPALYDTKLMTIRRDDDGRSMMTHDLVDKLEETWPVRP